MSDATYILGTVEYLLLEIEATTPGVTFDPDDWTAEVALVEFGDTLDIDAVPSVWSAATLITADGKDYAQVLLGDEIDPVAGKYHAFVRLTKTVGGTEIPLLRASGSVTIEEG